MHVSRIQYCAKAFAALGLSQNGQWSQSDIKSAYLKKAKECHPDAGGDAATFRSVMEAYGKLRTRSRCRVEFPNSESETDPQHYRGMRTHAPHRASDMWTERKRETDTDAGPGERYANRSTRSFYRPYTSNPNETGFTAAEIREAQSRTRMAMSYQFMKYVLLFVVFVYMVQDLLRKNRIHEAIEARGQGYTDKTYFERREQDQKEGRQPPLSSVSVAEYQRESEEKLRVMREHAQSESTRDKRGGMEARHRPQTVAVSYKGRPFTPEGLASCRGKGTGVPPISRQEDDLDTACDLDDV